MKKILFFLLCSAFCVPLSAQTEIKISPIPILFEAGVVSVEQGLSENWGLDLDIVAAPEFFGFNLSGKYYFDPRQGIDRFHVGIFTGNLGDGLGAGFLLGSKIVSSKRILFEFGIGAGRSFNDGLIGYGKLHIGYRFGAGR